MTEVVDKLLHSEADDKTEDSEIEQILYMINNLPSQEKRRTLSRLQPLMSSTFNATSAGEDDTSAGEDDTSARDDTATARDDATSARDDATAAGTSSASLPYQNRTKEENTPPIIGDSRGNFTISAGDSTIVLKTGSKPVTPKLREFSGMLPLPAGEVNFYSWKKAAARLCRTKEISDEEKSTMLANSLGQPALDMVQNALDATAPLEVVRLLDNAYGSVDDPRDMLNRYNATIMNSDEKASEYLSRLFLMLDELRQRGVVKTAETPSMLLKQFNYGCLDESLLLKLRLEEKEENPPDYGDLLLILRKEESKRAKKLELRNAPSSSPSSAQASAASAARVPVTSQPVTTGRETTRRETRNGRTSDRRKGRNKLRFCFKCGEDGHTVWSCENSANPILVSKRFDDAKQSGNA
jgi:hypothetical protein